MSHSLGINEKISFSFLYKKYPSQKFEQTLIQDHSLQIPGKRLQAPSSKELKLLKWVLHSTSENRHVVGNEHVIFPAQTFSYLPPGQIFHSAYASRLQQCYLSKIRDKQTPARRQTDRRLYDTPLPTSHYYSALQLTTTGQEIEHWKKQEEKMRSLCSTEHIFTGMQSSCGRRSWPPKTSGTRHFDVASFHFCVR